MANGRVVALVAALVVALGACGSGSSKTTSGDGSVTTTVPRTTDPSRTASATATTANGRYRITLTVGDRSPAGAATVCAPKVGPAMSSLSVTVTVMNDDAQRAVPFPPLRVELNAGGSPTPVPVRSSSGTCSFTPHDAALEGGASVILPGATPAIDNSAPAGSAGRVEIALSENTFSLAVPVP